jgi:DNA-directed DNA polymerase III PolC
MPYAALHNHSWFSLLDSTIPPEQVAVAAEACGMVAVGLTDRDTLAGAVAFWKKCRDLGLHAVTGSEVTVEDGSTVVLLVENARGYSNLCRLLTTRIEHPSGVTWADVGVFGEGLICLAGPRSALARAVRRNQPAEGELDRLRDIFGRNLALEIAPHHDEDLRLARLFAELARRNKVALTTGVDAHYLDESDRLRFDILQSMRTLTMLNQPHPEKLAAGRNHFHTPEEMTRYFGSLPQAMANTVRIAERCQFEFELGDIHFPKVPCADAVAELRARTRKGLERRYGPEPGAEVMERLEREMSIIEEVGYAEYFLVFAEIVDWCASKRISTLARGSAAGSLVCYLLGISNVCPFRFGLCFERFLNRERMQFAKLADIDLDLPWDRRDEVIRHVFDRYGREHVAMIGAVHTFQGRSAVADIAKVYGIPEREARRFTERLPWYLGDAREAVIATPECRDLPFNEEPYKTVLSLAGSFDGIPRHFAMHPCGLVVSGSAVVDKMPLFESSKGILTTHYTMDDVEELGLLKMDLLGQAGLTVLHDTLENLADSGKPAPDLDRLDWNDAQTWDVIAKGEARGVFHIESPAMTSLLVMTDCRDIDCLTTVESIIRPGAANEGKKRAFARRHQGLEPPSYAHPSLEPLLKDTYGLMAFEEHILLVANGFAAMPWGRADLLRRALVKNRDRARIDALGEEFKQSARALGRTEAEIDAVWALLRDFAGYMFNKAHSAAYAVEAFAGAWLKTRYPVEFLSAVLTSRRGFYSPMLYVLEALRNGARFLAPDLNESDAKRFLTQGETVRLPLDQVKGLTAKTREKIVDGRPYADAGEFYRKARPARDEWLSLLKSGTLDGLGEPRGRLFWRLQRLESSTKKGGAEPWVNGELPESFEAGVETRAKWEVETLGFPVSLHPLECFGPKVAWKNYVTVARLTERQSEFYGKTVRVCGLVVADRHHPTAQGTMKFLTLADWTGFVEVSLFAKTYREYGHLTVKPVLSVEATVDAHDNRKGFSLNGSRVGAVQ